MFLHAQSQSLRVRIAPVLALALCMAVLVTLCVSALPAGASDSTNIAVVATGQFDGLPASSTVAGVVSTSPGGQVFPYTFSISCPGCTGVTNYVWNFGDGTTPVSSSSQGSATSNAYHPYSATGVYTATVTATNTTGSGGVGQGAVTVLVSPRFSDADASNNTSGDAAPANRGAIWTVAALGILEGATSYTNVGQTHSTFTPVPVAAPTGTPSITATAVNGGTGLNCFTQATGLGSNFTPPPYENCGLPFASFNNATDGSNSANNPTNTCGANCQAALTTAGYLRAGQVVLSATDCGLGWTATQEGTYYQATPGVPTGCVSRGQFYAALVAALDGASSLDGSHIPYDSLTPGTDWRLASLTTACPGDASTVPAAYQQAFERASSLGISTTYMGSQNCNPNAPMDKGEAYQLLAGVTGMPSATCSATPYADLNDTNLAAAGTTPSVDPNCGLDLALVNGPLHVPVVDNTTCVTAPTQTCFNPYDPLTRGGAAELLAALVVGTSSPVTLPASPNGSAAASGPGTAYNGWIMQQGGLAGLWEMNDNPGLTQYAYDSSGNNLYGNYYQGCATTALSTGAGGMNQTNPPSPVGPYTSLTSGSSGCGSTVVVPNPFAGAGAASTSFSLWFKASPGSTGPLLSAEQYQTGASYAGADGKASTPRASWPLLWVDSGSGSLCVADPDATVDPAIATLACATAYSGSASQYPGQATGQAVNDGKWHQVTLTYNCTATAATCTSTTGPSGSAKLYLDGAYVGTYQNGLGSILQNLNQSTYPTTLQVGSVYDYNSSSTGWKYWSSAGADSLGVADLGTESVAMSAGDIASGYALAGVANPWSAYKAAVLADQASGCSSCQFWRLADNTSTTPGGLDGSWNCATGASNNSTIFGPTNDAPATLEQAGKPCALQAIPQSTVQVTGGASFEAWVRVLSSGATQTVYPLMSTAKMNLSMYSNCGSQSGTSYAQNPSTKPDLSLQIATSSWAECTSTYYTTSTGGVTPFDDNQWHLVDGVLAKSGGLYIYVDGVRQQATPESTSASVPTTFSGFTSTTGASAGIIVGSSTLPSTAESLGLANAAFYTTALTPARLYCHAYAEQSNSAC